MPLRYKKLIVLFSLGIMFIGLGIFSLLSPDFRQEQTKNNNPDRLNPSTFGAIQSADGKSKADITDEITDLMQTYFTAKQALDMDTITHCVSDISHVNVKKLAAEAEYVESYQNIQCLILDGEKKNYYRVYVRYDVKIYDIDTLIPSLNALYVKLEEDGTFQIYLGTLTAEEQDFISQLDQCDQVKKLVNTVQNNLHSVISEHEDVRQFYNMLENK